MNVGSYLGHSGPLSARKRGKTTNQESIPSQASMETIQASFNGTIAFGGTLNELAFPFVGR